MSQEKVHLCIVTVDFTEAKEIENNLILYQESYFPMVITVFL